MALICKIRPAIMGNHEETIEHAECEGRDSEEIHSRNRCNRFTVIVKKGLPTSCRLWVLGCSLHPAGNGSFADIEAKFQQLAVNLGCAPGWILGDHLEDQIAHLFADPFSPRDIARPRKPTPQYMRNLHDANAPRFQA